MKVLLTAFVLSVFSLTFSGNLFAYPGCNLPDACNFDPNATSNNGSCVMPIYLIPVILIINADTPPTRSGGGGSPALLLCFGDDYDPNTYFFANQECVESVVTNDPFCGETSWDTICQTAYNECCPEENWYIPNPFFNYTFADDGGITTFGGGSSNNPAVVACSPPTGYILADDLCILDLIQADTWCVFIDFDNLCYSAYFACTIGCNDPVIAIPDPCGSEGGPVVVNDPSERVAPAGGGTPAIIVCEDDIPPGYIAAESQECAGQATNSDAFCTEVTWDNLCVNAYNSCISGCTYEFSCNYNPVAIIDDGSCGYPGCTDSEAVNYDENASCDNGLCVYPPDPICLGDLNGDNQINVSDLTIFLSVYGTSCGIE